MKRILTTVAIGLAGLMPLAHGYNPHWKGYQQRARRHIPLIVLTPLGDGHGA